MSDPTHFKDRKVRKQFPHSTLEENALKDETIAGGFKKVSRPELIELLNQDLSREYQAIIGYVVYSQVLKGAEFMNIAGELEKHAAQEPVSYTHLTLPTIYSV